MGRLLDRGTRAIRRLGASGRALPDFVIAGAQKAGTTSLHAYLLQHPQILPATRKEVHYFDLNWGRSEAWYRSHFPRIADLEAAAGPGQRAITGEASPYYLFHPNVAERLAASLPAAKLIVLLRDPVARAYSHYRHNVRKREIALSFAEALELEAKLFPRVADELQSGALDRSLDHQLHSYLARGRYAEQLERWFKYIPRERMLILRSEDLFDDPQAVYSEVLRFLSLPEWRVDSTRAYNIGRYDPGAIPQEDRLRSYFRPYNRNLYAMLGHDFGW